MVKEDGEFMRTNQKIIVYSVFHKVPILELFHLNSPKYFAPYEEKDLLHYLEQEREDYFVIEVDSEIVGCGGINYSEDKKIAKISWDIMHPDFHGKGLGSELLRFRLEKIKGNKTVEQIIVRTSQLAFRFYEKNGFKLVEIQENYWAEGFDLYLMIY